MRPASAALLVALLAFLAAAPLAAAQLPAPVPAHQPVITLTITAPAEPLPLTTATLVPVAISVELPGPTNEGTYVITLAAQGPGGWSVTPIPAEVSIPYTASPQAQTLTATAELEVRPAPEAPALTPATLTLTASSPEAGFYKAATGTGTADVLPAFGGAALITVEKMLVYAAPAQATPLQVSVEAALNGASQLTVVPDVVPEGCELGIPDAKPIPAAAGVAGGHQDAFTITVTCAAATEATVEATARFTLDGGNPAATPYDVPFSFTLVQTPEAAGEAPASFGTEPPQENATSAPGALLALAAAAAVAFAARRR